MFTIEARYRSGKRKGERSNFTGDRGAAVFYRGRAQVDELELRDELVNFFGYTDVTTEVAAGARQEKPASYAPRLAPTGRLP